MGTDIKVNFREQLGENYGTIDFETLESFQIIPGADVSIENISFDGLKKTLTVTTNMECHIDQTDFSTIFTLTPK